MEKIQRSLYEHLLAISSLVRAILVHICSKYLTIPTYNTAQTTHTNQPSPPPRHPHHIPQRPKRQDIRDSLLIRKQHNQPIKSTSPTTSRRHPPLQHLEITLVNLLLRRTLTSTLGTVKRELLHKLASLLKRRVLLLVRVYVFASRNEELYARCDTLSRFRVDVGFGEGGERFWVLRYEGWVRTERLDVVFCKGVKEAGKCWVRGDREREVGEEGQEVGSGCGRRKIGEFAGDGALDCRDEGKLGEWGCEVDAGWGGQRGEVCWSERLDGCVETVEELLRAVDEGGQRGADFVKFAC